MTNVHWLIGCIGLYMIIRAFWIAARADAADRLERAQKWRRAKLRERAWGVISRQRELNIGGKPVAWQIAYQRHREAVGVVRAIERGDV